ncbi:MAG: transporter [Bacteroidales bacterium]|nr:transporter [Candidatus Colimorpha onthohippi]
MKKVFLFVAAVVFAFAANAQFTLTGSLGFDSYGKGQHYDGEKIFNGDSYKYNVFNIDLMAGYQFNEKWEAGIILGYSTGADKYFIPSGKIMQNQDMESFSKDGEYYEKEIRNEFSAGIYGRYTFASVGKLNFFAQASAEFYIENEKLETKDALGSRTDDYETAGKGLDKTIGFNIAITPGVNYALNEHLSFDLWLNFISLEYNNYKTTTKTMLNKDFGSTYSYFSFSCDGFGNFVSLGIKYRF